MSNGVVLGRVLNVLCKGHLGGVGGVCALLQARVNVSPKVGCMQKEGKRISFNSRAAELDGFLSALM